LRSSIFLFPYDVKVIGDTLVRRGLIALVLVATVIETPTCGGFHPQQIFLGAPVAGYEALLMALRRTPPAGLVPLAFVHHLIV
jgi:hypothetical protein